MVILILVSCGHTPFRKRGKGSGNFFYSSLFRRSVQCGTNHSALFCHMSVVICLYIVMSVQHMSGIFPVQLGTTVIMILSYESLISLHVQTQHIWLAVPDTDSRVTCSTDTDSRMTCSTDTDSRTTCSKKIWLFIYWMQLQGFPHWLPYIHMS